MRIQRVLLWLLVTCIIAAPLHAADRRVRDAVVSLLNSYASAIRQLDGDKMVSLYWNSPEFFLWSDGKTYTYPEIVAFARNLSSTVQRVDTTWDAIDVRALNAGTAVAFATFHQIVVDRSGVEKRLVGEVTWIVVRDRGAWKLAYGHANHRPAPAQ